MRFTFLLATALLSGCSVNQAPLMNFADLSSQDFSNLENAKTGEACQKYFIGLPFGTEKASVATAITNGDISKVLLVEYTAKAGFFINRSCVTVYGD